MLKLLGLPVPGVFFANDPESNNCLVIDWDGFESWEGTERQSLHVSHLSNRDDLNMQKLICHASTFSAFAGNYVSKDGSLFSRTCPSANAETKFQSRRLIRLAIDRFDGYSASLVIVVYQRN